MGLSPRPDVSLPRSLRSLVRVYAMRPLHRLMLRSASHSSQRSRTTRLQAAPLLAILPAGAMGNEWHPCTTSNTDIDENDGTIPGKAYYLHVKFLPWKSHHIILA